MILVFQKICGEKILVLPFIVFGFIAILLGDVLYFFTRNTPPEENEEEKE